MASTLSIEILTLGRTAVRKDGAEIESLPAQPLRFALLVRVAAGDVSRDELIAMFWPRRKGSRARHSLNQTLYQLRTVLGQDALVTVGETVRLGDHVHFDAAAFEAATAAGAPDAVERYGGPFLDAFPAPTPRFGEWAEELRTRLACLHEAQRRARVIGHLAAEDHAAALEEAAAWSRAEGPAGEGQRRLEDLLEQKRGAGALRQHDARAVPSPRSRLVPVGLAALLVLAFTGIGISFRLLPGAGAATRPAVAVIPFTGERPPADPAAPHLAVAEAVGWMDGWTSVETPDVPGPGVGWDPGRAAQTLRRADRLGYRYLITGDVGVPGDGPPITVEAWDVATGRRILRETAHAGEPAEEALARLRFAVVRALIDAEPVDPLPRSLLDGTRDPAAAGRFLEGRARFRDGDPAGAARAFDAATVIDPHFARAWTRLVLTALWTGDTATALETVARAAPALAGRPGADRVAALGRLAEGRLAAVSELEALAARHPGDPDAVLAAALAMDALGPFLGIGPGHAGDLYERALDLDPGYGPVAARAFDLTLAAGDRDRAERLLHAVGHHDQPLRSLVLAATAAEARRSGPALDSLRWLEAADLLAVFDVLVRSDLQAADTVAALLQLPGRTPSEQAAGASRRLIAMAAAGAPAEALMAWRRTGDPRDETLVVARLAGATSEPPWTALLAAGTPRIAAHHASIFGDSAIVLRILRSPGPDRGDRNGAEAASLEHALRARLHLLADDTTSALYELKVALDRAPWPREGTPPLACLGAQRLLALRLHVARGNRVIASRLAHSFRLAGCPSDPLFAPAADSILAAANRTPGHR